MGKPGGEGTGPAWAQGVDGPTVCRSLRASAAADLGGGRWSSWCKIDVCL